MNGTIAHSTTPAAAPPAAMLPPQPFAAALERALREARGRVVLRVEDTLPHRRKLARALLQEGALAAGGQVLDGPGGELWLIGAEAGRAQRLLGLLEGLIAPATAEILSLERDAARLRAQAAGGPAPRVANGPAPQSRPAGDGPDLMGLDAFLDALPLASVLRRMQGWPVHGRGTRPAFLRLEPDRARLAAALGALGADADILYHATRCLDARLVAALSDPAELRGLLGPVIAPRLHLPLSPDLRPGGTEKLPPGMLVATLPLAALAEPMTLASRIAALTAAGIGLEIDGLDAAALGLLEPAALPDALFRLRWSPALDEPWAAPALARLGPQRVVLTRATPDQASRLGAAFLEVEAP